MNRPLLRMLVLLYPRAWRRRYGAEFVQLMADLEAEHPEQSRRRMMNVAMNAVSAQISSRPTTAVIALCVSGALAFGIYGNPRKSPVTGTPPAHQLVITREGKTASFVLRTVSSPGKGHIATVRRR